MSMLIMLLSELERVHADCNWGLVGKTGPFIKNIDYFGFAPYDCW
jgi:hypothetical protein